MPFFHGPVYDDMQGEGKRVCAEFLRDAGVLQDRPPQSMSFLLPGQESRTKATFFSREQIGFLVRAIMASSV